MSTKLAGKLSQLRLQFFSCREIVNIFSSEDRQHFCNVGCAKLVEVCGRFVGELWTAGQTLRGTVKH